MSQFVHLHLHTQYSVLDGAIKIKEVIKRAKECGHSAVAMTDHGNMHGAVEFYDAAKAADVKPIIGCEVYITPGSRFEKKPKAQGGSPIHHLTLLCKDLTGYRNLCRLVTLGYTEGFYFKPRIDPELLAEYSKGLICLSGCLSSEFAGFSKKQDIDGAEVLVRKYQEIFGERYFLEVQPHTVPEQQSLNKMARELGSKLGIPLVATNDCHYISPDDHYAQEVLMCISTGKLITDPDRIKHDGARLHFKTREEMLLEIPEFEDAIDHTRLIGEQCNVNFDFSNYYMPQYAPPKEVTLDEYFEAQAQEGLKMRFAEMQKRLVEITESVRTQYETRLSTEIRLILEMGFGGYFLVVSDFIRWAKRNNIPVGPGRGSAAGSLVAWVLSITDVDPIEHNLLFERFLNPERVSLPDIDVDFCIFGRDKVIEYVAEKYGKDKVAQIVTFGTLKAKAVIKDVGRALGLSYAETDRVAKLVPAPRQGFDYPIAEALKMEKRLREYADTEEGGKLITLAQKLEGLSRHTSTHAAGLVIADRPIVEYMPLMVDKDGQIVTQYSMNWVEKIGLVKFDFLGLKTLSVLHRATMLIRESTGEEIDLNALPMDCKKTYSLVSSGRTTGVFQLESGGITEMVTRLKPSCFEDLVAILALYRPGPLDAGMVDHYINRKHGREPVKYIHPTLEPILRDTWGIMLYQEQIMQIARDLAGYSLGEADMLRRAMGKKKPEEMAKQREKFTSGAEFRGVATHVATEVFDQMETFARYGFNRSHSVAYALISYQTAYLKAHHPVCFMAALMTFEMNDTDRTLKNLGECREAGTPVLPPNVNLGSAGFRVSGGSILFGLAAIKGVGEKAIDKILEQREKDGEFKSLLDFCRRVDSTVLNRRVLENLIKSGAFDWTRLSRAELIERLEDVVKRAASDNAKKNTAQMGLFDSVQGGATEDVYEPNRKLLTEWPVNIKLSHEREALGFYLSGHPLEKFRSELQRFGAATISNLSEMNDGAQVTVAGVVTLLKLKNTKKGDRYATFVLEDLRETIDVIVWPDTMRNVQAMLASEDPIVLTAKLEVSDERRQLIANKVESAIAIRDRSAKEAVLVLNSKVISPEKLQSMREVFRNHQGELPVKIILRTPNHSETYLTLGDEVSVQPSEALSNQLEKLFGSPVLTFR